MTNTTETPAANDTNKSKKFKPVQTAIGDLWITNPPSMLVLYTPGDVKLDQTIELAPGHKNFDRMDLIFENRDGKVAAMKGQEAPNAGELPVPPNSPEGCRPIANVYIKTNQTYLDEFSVQKPYLDTPYQLDPRDPFESLIINIVGLERSKRGDYANDDNIFRNLDYVSSAMELNGYTPLEDARAMVIRKLGRLSSLRGRDPNHENIEDSYIDFCVYAILMYGLYLRDGQ